jgi:predicted nucleic-acid-binding Zn-ribbon protein
MKQCEDCNSLCSNSTSKCHVCGSRNLVKGSYTTKEEAQQKLQEVDSNKNDVIQCSLCYSPVPITNGKGYCVYCDEDIYIYNEETF